MPEELPKCYRQQLLLDKRYIPYREKVWKKFANKKVKIVPSETGFNSFKELEQYNGHIGTAHNINFTCNGHAAYIYVTGCPLALDEKFLGVL